MISEPYSIFHFTVPMKIVILRHEKRHLNDATFDSVLTVDGNLSAETNVPLSLNQYNITHIYSSPFTRCLETIHTFANNTSLKVMCDNGLYERIQFTSGFLKSTYKRTARNLFSDIIHQSYKSVVSLDSIQFNETVLNVQQRSQSFLNHILRVHNDNDTILIVTHLSVANAMLNREDADKRLAMGNIECLSIPAISPLPFSEWIMQPSLQYNVSENTYLKGYSAIKMLLHISGKFITHFLSVLCMLISTCITRHQYKRFCKWHIYITSTYTRLICSSSFKRIHSTFLTEMKEYAKTGWSDFVDFKTKCNDKFGNVYEEEQDEYRNKNEILSDN